MDSILSASSLLLTIITVLYALWYHEITEALNIKPNKFKDDRVGQKNLINNILISRLIPLFSISIIVSLVFIPDAIRILCNALTIAFEDKSKTNYRYSSVKMAFTIVVFFTICISCHSGYMIKRALKLKQELEK